MGSGFLQRQTVRLRKEKYLDQLIYTNQADKCYVREHFPDNNAIIAVIKNFMAFVYASTIYKLLLISNEIEKPMLVTMFKKLFL